MKVLDEGTRVRDTGGNEGVIVDVLSTQYFVEHDSGAVEWYFFKDNELKGVEDE